MRMNNKFILEFSGISENVAFARLTVAGFAAELDPDCGELSELKTAVSEAVTNAIIHGYKNKEGYVRIEGRREFNTIFLSVSDNGEGIEDVARAMQPLYTDSENGERSGMGFTIMEAFMDEVRVESEKGSGTTVHMKKTIGVEAGA